VCLWAARKPGRDDGDDGQDISEFGGQHAIPADMEEEIRVFHVVFPREAWSEANDSSKTFGGGMI